MNPAQTPSQLPDAPREISAAAMIRRSLFILLLIGLALFHLMIDFRGLTHRLGMDQAQISREVFRGNSFTTKVIRPVALFQTSEHLTGQGKAPAKMHGFYDTFHAPLNPLFNSVVIWLGRSDLEFKGHEPGESPVYLMDYWIAAASVVLFLCAIGISYLLVARIFDAKIAGVTAFLLLLCNLLWEFTKTGLPQMLMLFLFSFALYFLYKAVENQCEGRSPYLWAALGGGFLGLLALSHWLTVWVFIGLVVFAAAYFRPRGVVAVMVLAIFAGTVSVWLFRNYVICGDAAGMGRFIFYAGLPGLSEGAVMRNADPESLLMPLQGLFGRTVTTSLSQLEDLYQYLGAVLAAPLFFLALLHPFKRREIADFRWCILSMWVFAVIGMSLFGLAEQERDANQLHFLFIPVMTAYGLAFLSIIWNRLSLPMEIPVVRNGHFVLAIVISALPLVLSFPKDLKFGIAFKERAKVNYPPYHPPIIKTVAELSDPHEIVVSDIPWAMAWYGDRTSLWVPRTVGQFEKLFTRSYDDESPVSGLFLTPATTNEPLARGILRGENEEWSPLVLRETLKFSWRQFGAAFGDDFPLVPAAQFAESEMLYFSDKSDTTAP